MIRFEVLFDDIVFLQISMPSGSHVTVSTTILRRSIFLNIVVNPLRVDAYHTTGLCGNYNFDRTDDGPGSTQSRADCREYCEQYR